jgi:hypothetical protein
MGAVLGGFTVETIRNVFSAAQHMMQGGPSMLAPMYLIGVGTGAIALLAIRLGD